MKVCRDCKIEKLLSDFYVHAAMLDGHLNKCKECVKNRVNKHRLNNLEAAQKYDKERNMLPHRVKARKEYLKTEAGIESIKKTRKNYKTKYPLRYAAHIIFGNSIRDGKAVKGTECSICGSDYKLQGHHDDYTKPYDVRWLCEPCHKQWHRENTPIYE